VQAWTSTVWDSSNLLPTDSPLGVLLHALAGYDAQPSGLQLAFYLGTVLAIAFATRYVRQQQTRTVRAGGPARART
jgi:high-affinity iron transporter